MKKLLAKHFRIISFLIAFGSIMPFFVISIYSRPSADDYSYSRYVIGLIRSGEANAFNLIKTAIAVDILEWKTYDGPYISQIIMTLQPGIYGEKYYCIGAMALIALVFACFFGAFRNLVSLMNIEEITKRFGTGVMAIVATALIMSGMPCISEGIYWFDGAWNYLPFFFLMLYNVTLILKYMCRANDKKEIPCLIITSVVAFVASGGNYIVTYANVIAMFSLAVFAVIRKKYGYIAPFVTAIGGFCLEFFSPGRMIRTNGDMGETQGIIATIVGTIKSVYAYLCEWINVQYVMWLLAVLIVTLFITNKDKRVVRFKVNPIWVFTYTICFVGALFLLPCYAVGTDIVGRVLNIVWFVFVLLSGADIAYLACYLHYEKDFRTDSWNEGFTAGVLLIAIITMCFFNNSNTIIALRELRNGTAEKFKNDNDVRYEAMKNANEGDVLTCTPLTRSYILFFDDLDENPEGWQNVAWQKYYGIGMYVVKE